MVTAKTSLSGDPLDSAHRFAVLIDADNAQAAVIEGLLTEVSRYGTATVKRIYGDFTSTASSSWKKVLQKHAIKPIQQFAYSSGKNATDSSLIIDAMDLLYSQRFDGFCLVTSDSDFTGLAMRLREAGLLVLGFGEKKTPEAFRNACHKFIFTEVLRPNAGETSEKPNKRTKKTKTTTETSTTASIETVSNEPVPMQMVTQALDMSEDDEGWANLGTFGSYLTKLQPDFDPRNFGYKKLSDFVKGRKDIFETESRTLSGTSNKQLYVRIKPRK